MGAYRISCADEAVYIDFKSCASFGLLFCLLCLSHLDGSGVDGSGVDEFSDAVADGACDFVVFVMRRNFRGVRKLKRRQDPLARQRRRAGSRRWPQKRRGWDGRTTEDHKNPTAQALE